jgi:serine/threonine-protein kinase
MPSLVREGEIFAGKYRVEHILGEGGYGLVFAARNLELDERVAVKLLKRASVDETTADRFFREARAAQKIRGDGVARVFAVDRLDDGDLYMVMEYLDGQDLKKEVTTSGKLDVHDAVECILQACDVLGQAHTLGIVHRDIKSANLFSMRRDDGRRQIKVLDFGIARSLDPVDVSLTPSPQMMGSPSYMAPEQIVDSRSVDERADIWGLGATLFELLAGIPPFGGGTLLQMLLRVQEHPPDDLRSLRPDVPEDLQRIVERCLEKQRDRRYPDVGSLAAALGPFRVRAEPSTGERSGELDATVASSGDAPTRVTSAWTPSATLPLAAHQPSFHPVAAGGAALASTMVSPAAAPVASLRPSQPLFAAKAPLDAAPVTQANASSSSLLLTVLGAVAALLVVGIFVALVRRRMAAEADADARTTSETAPTPVPMPMPMPMPTPTPMLTASPESPAASPPPTVTAPRGARGPRGAPGGKPGAVRPTTPTTPGPAPMPDDRQ